MKKYRLKEDVISDFGFKEHSHLYNAKEELKWWLNETYFNETALEEVDERVEVVSSVHQDWILMKKPRFPWTEQEREDIEKFLNVFGSWEKMIYLIHSYSDFWRQLSDTTIAKDCLTFRDYLKEKGYE